MRPKIGLGTGMARGSVVHTPAAAVPVSGVIRPKRWSNAQVFHGGAFAGQNIAAGHWANQQVFHSLATISAPASSLAAGDLHPVSVAPINQGLVFCIGSHPSGSSLLTRDLVSRNLGTILLGGNSLGLNADHGTWRCLENTSLSDGGASFPNSSQLRSITTQRTFAFHGEIDAFGTWSHLISIPYASGTWVQPWMSHSFRRQSSTGANLNTHAATGGTGYASVSSAGGFATGRHWFVVAIDGAAGVARFYADGAQVGGDLGISTAPVDWGGNQPITIFNRSSTNVGEATDGRCFTAAIWNRVLSAAEIASLVTSPRQMFNLAGTASLAATKFVNDQLYHGPHQIVDPTAPTTHSLQASLFHEPQIFRSHVITVAPPPGGSSVGPLEAIDSSAALININVGTQPRQAWLGYGWGTGGSTSSQLSAYNTHVTKICEEMNAKVVRFFTPEGSDFLSRHLGAWNLFKNHGIDVVFTSSFVYRTAHSQGHTNYNINAVADGIHAAMNAGMNPSHLFACTLQNEPDGHPDNRIPSGGLSVVRSHQNTLRNRLDSHGRQAVRIVGLEWRHPQALSSEFDGYNGEDMIPDVVADGCMHIYDDGLTPSYYDNRWMPKGRGIWSTETGDNNTPKTQAQFISGLNHGKVVEIAHIALGSFTAGANNNQLLVTTSGDRMPWWYASSIVSKHLQRGMVFRKCISSDRPTDPRMPETQAAEMIWDSSTNPCGPRQMMGVGRRTDGRWVLVAINFAFDNQVATSFSGGHYGELRQQLEVFIPEQSSVDRVWSGQRAPRTGGTSNTSVNMRAGRMRFTLSPGETIAITQNAP